MISSIPAKSILHKVNYDGSKWFGINYNMNLYHGCSHGCIYCDSRSDKYHIENFNQVRYKANAIEILRRELSSKRQKGIVGIGAMSDTYNPFEKELCLTQQALELIAANHFGVSIDTKSDLIVRDIPLLQKIMENNSVIVKITITTCNDNLSKIIEPNVAVSSSRFNVIEKLSKAGIFCGILLTPTLPFLTDTEKEITEIVKTAHEVGAKFIYCMYGMTMRDGQREYFYEHLKSISPKLPQLYHQTYGYNYVCNSPNMKECKMQLEDMCHRYGILTDMNKIIAHYKKPEPFTQLSLFEDKNI